MYNLFNETPKKKPELHVEGLLNPEQLYFEAIQKGGLKRPKNDIIERDNSKRLTNDGRELLK